LYELSAETAAKEIAVDNLRRFLERRGIECQTVLSSKGAEVLETPGLTNGLLGMKMNANRGKSEQFIREIDQHQSRTSTVHSNRIQISEEVRMPEEVLDGLNIRLSKLYDTIRTQDERLETIHSSVI
jgi:hypothetical protein